MGTYRITTLGAATELLDLPLGLPLADWDDPRMVQVPRGISRHVVRFARVHNEILAVKEADSRYVAREHPLLASVAEASVPVVEAFGTVLDRVGADGAEMDSLLITKHLPYSLPYRSLFTERSLPDLRARLLDALTQLFLRLHLAGFSGATARCRTPCSGARPARWRPTWSTPRPVSRTPSSPTVSLPGPRHGPGEHRWWAD